MDRRGTPPDHLDPGAPAYDEDSPVIEDGPPPPEIDLTGADSDAGQPMTVAQRIRAQAKEATRQALLESGLALTVEQGGEIPSIEAICKQTGYTRGAFYVYFRDREHFVHEMLDWVLTDIIWALFESRGSGTASVHEIVTRFNDDLAEGRLPDLQSNVRAAYLAVLRELRPDSSIQEAHARLMSGICERLTARVREGQEEGTIRTDVDATALATLLVLTAIGAIMWNGLGILTDRRTVGSALLVLVDPEGAGS